MAGFMCKLLYDVSTQCVIPDIKSILACNVYSVIKSWTQGKYVVYVSINKGSIYIL